MNTDTSAVIVSAGQSTRMNGINKQFAKINDTEIIVLSMLALQRCESVGEIIVVTRSEDINRVQILAKDNGIDISAVIEGGSTRQQSVICGLKASSKEYKYIAVHDGARPLVKSEDIERVIHDARVFGGATLGVPVKDTIKIVNDGLIADTPYRPSLYITQTPQVFRKTVYYEGVDFALEHELDFTDDCQLAEAVNVKVHMTVGSYSNIKVTTPEDLVIAEALLKSSLTED